MQRKPMPPRTKPMSRTPLRKRRSGKRRTLAAHDGSWLDAVRSIACCVRCGAAGVEAAHCDIDKGMGMKTDDVTACALCPACHYELGQGNKLERGFRRSEMDRCLRLTLIALFRAGLVGVTGAAA